MTEFRTARSEDLAEVVSLSDKVFRRPGQVSMGPAFVDLFSSNNAENLWIVREDDKVVSLMGLLPATIQFGPSRVRVVSMGSVCTDSEYRNRRYASELLTRSLAHVESLQAPLLLVSGERSLYTRAQCMRVGTSWTADWTVSAADSSDAANALKLREWTPADSPALAQLLEQEECHYVRSAEDMTRLIQAEAHLSCYPAEQRVYVGLKDDAVVAYTVLGLIQHEGTQAGEIIEFAGETSAVFSLLKSLPALHGLGRLRLNIPTHRRDVAEAAWNEGASVSSSSIAGTIRLMNLNTLWEQLDAYRESALDAQEQNSLKVEMINDGVWRFALGKEQLTVDRAAATRLVFDGPALRGTSPLAVALRKLFPLPFPDPNGLNYV